MEFLGKVTSGRRYASEVIPAYTHELEDLLTFHPYPGTLNVRLYRPVHLGNGQLWRGPDDGFARLLVPATINGIDVFINRWSGCPYLRVDIIAPVNLRETLSVIDGSSVTIAISPNHLKRLPPRAMLQWGWELFRRTPPQDGMKRT